MTRWLSILTIFAVLAAWADAQGPAATAPLSAEDRLRLLKANSTLIEHLVSDGVAISGATDTVDRARHCRSAARSLVNAIEQAAAAEDAERVAVLTGLFTIIVREGLTPTLQEASKEVTPESPQGKQLRAVRETAGRDLNDLKAAIAKSEKLTASSRVQAAIQQLGQLPDIK